MFLLLSSGSNSTTGKGYTGGDGNKVEIAVHNSGGVGARRERDRELVHDDHIPLLFNEKHHDGQIDAAQRSAQDVSPAKERAREEVAVDFNGKRAVVRFREGMRSVVVRSVHNNVVSMFYKTHCRIHHLFRAAHVRRGFLAGGGNLALLSTIKSELFSYQSLSSPNAKIWVHEGHLRGDEQEVK